MNYGGSKTESLISLYFEQEYAYLSYEESGRMWNKIGVIFFNLTIVGLLSWWISQVRRYPFLPLIEMSVWLRDKLGLDVPKGGLCFSFLLSFFFIEFFHTIHFDLHFPFPSSFQILPTPHPQLHSLSFALQKSNKRTKTTIVKEKTQCRPGCCWTHFILLTLQNQHLYKLTL